MKKPQSHSLCTIMRVKQVTHGTMSLVSGAYTRDKTETVTEPCGSSLFEEKRRASGICRSCAEGWEVEENRFANKAEKAKALAAPKTLAQ